MKRGRSLGKRSGCTFRIFQGVFLIFALFLFRHELGRALLLFKALGGAVLRIPVDVPATDVWLREVLYIALNIVSYAFFGYMLVYLMSGAIFPLQPGVGRWEVIRRFNQFFFGARRPVIQVRQAQLRRELQPGETVRGGAAIVDAESAIVLERTSPVRDGKSEPSRVARPGVTLIGQGERLQTIVSLRKQARSNKDVSAQTIDGIEVKTSVSVVFTLGQPASIIKVAYDGDPLSANLRVVQIDEKSKQILSLSDELDAEDKREIHAYAQQFVTFNEPAGTLEATERGQDYPPFEVNEGRIRAAGYALARNPLQDRTDHWTDLPAQVATEIFRNMLAKERYDALYIADTADMYSLEQKPPGKFSLVEDLKPAFARRMRYQGVMSYQFLQHIGGRQPAVGLRVDGRRFRISPVQNLANSRILRDLGIKVIAAGFSELIPNQKIYDQRLDNWRARKQQDVDMHRAAVDREVLKIKNNARLEAQKKLIRKLNELFKANNYTDDALTWAILQSLEELAARPGTRQFLPQDPVKMVRDITDSLISNTGQTLLQPPSDPGTRLPASPPNEPDEPPKST